MTHIEMMGYVTLEEAVDAVGMNLMPHDWLGHETDLLRREGGVTEEEPVRVGEEEARRDSPLRRLNRAVRHLVAVLAAGDVNAVVLGEDGQRRELSSAFWRKPGILEVFHSEELPVHFRVDLEGHKAGAGRRWVLVSKSDLKKFLHPPRVGRERPDAETEFRAWLTAKVDEAAGKQPPGRQQMWTEAQGAFGARLTYQAFGRVWRETVPETWR